MDANAEHPLISPQTNGAIFDAKAIEKIREYHLKHPTAFASGATLDPADSMSLATILAYAIRESPHIDERLLESYAQVLYNGAADGALGSAYRNGRFWDFLNPSSASTPEDRASSNGASLKSAFEAEYRGDRHRLLIDILTRSWESRSDAEVAKRHYNLAVPVIQSSGMGKSRMIDEVSKFVFTIPINLARRPGEGLATYPPPDDEIREYFCERISSSDIEQQVEYAILLCALFGETARLLDADRFHGLSGESLAREWYEYLREGRTKDNVGKNRQAFLDTVAKRARELKLKRSTLGSKLPTKLRSTMEKSCEALGRAISRANSSHTTFCYVYFDEANMLMNPQVELSETCTQSPYHNLGRVLACLAPYPVFFIFLSTNSQPQKIAPPPTDMSSILAMDGMYLIPPFTELPFDIFKEDTIGPLAKCGELTLQNVCKTDVVVGFGRGLWYPHHKSWLEEGGLHVFELAMTKLVGMSLYVDPFKPQIAALSSRIGIEFDLRTQSSRAMEAEMIESYMRVVYAIPEHREYMRSGSSSEPILANAAAEYLDKHSNGGGIQTIGPEILAEAVKRGLFAEGQCAALCGRLLLTAAHDIATKRIEDKRSPAKLDPRVHQPVPVLDFLRALFHEGSHGKTLGARPITCAPGVPSLEAAFANSFISFSHFALARNSSALSTTNLAEALIRGVAFYVQDDRHSIDAVIPIHMGPVTSRISRITTSAINLQFNNQKDIHPCQIDRTITVPNPNTPVLSIVFEFGVEGKDLDVTRYNTSTSEINQTHIDDHHYQIVIYGCGSETFAAIPQKVEARYGSILSTDASIQDFLDQGSHRAYRPCTT